MSQMIMKEKRSNDKDDDGVLKSELFEETYTPVEKVNK